MLEFRQTSSRLRFKRKVKVLSSSKCQTDLSLITENSDTSIPHQESHDLITLHNSQSNMDLSSAKQNVFCTDCEQQSRKCANCTLRKLMRQHMNGKLKIEDLKSTLTKICLDSDPEYKRNMIEALETFRGNIRERKRHTSSGSGSSNRIENFIDAIQCNKNILMRRNRECCLLPQKQTFDSAERLYLKYEKKRKISVENVAVGPSIKVLESVNDEIPIKMNQIDQATDPIQSHSNLESIKSELNQIDCVENLQEILKYVDKLLQTKWDMQICQSFTEVVEPIKQAEIVEEENEEFVEAEECLVEKESKSLTAIKKKLSKNKENSCLIS